MNLHRNLAIVLSICIGVGVFASPGIGAPPPSGVLSTDVSGDGYVMDISGTPAVWQDESVTVTVRVGDETDTDPHPRSSEYFVRLLDQNHEAYSPLMGGMIGESRVSLEELEATTVTFTIPANYFDSPGKQTLYANMYTIDPGADSRMDSSKVTVKVLNKNGDLDGDGLVNVAEANGPTSLTSEDSDGDGIIDGLEVEQFGTNPMSKDTDGDKLSDLAEIRTHKTNPLRVDTDGDSLSDYAEIRELETSPIRSDSDSDGLGDGEEVRRYETNPIKKDSDGDGLSDRVEIAETGTDPMAYDSDDDGMGDLQELASSQAGSTEPTVSQQAAAESPTSASTEQPTASVDETRSPSQEEPSRVSHPTTTISSPLLGGVNGPSPFQIVGLIGAAPLLAVVLIRWASEPY